MCYGKSFERTLVRVAIAYLVSLITHFYFPPREVYKRVVSQSVCPCVPKKFDGLQRLSVSFFWT